MKKVGVRVAHIQPDGNRKRTVFVLKALGVADAMDKFRRSHPEILSGENYEIEAVWLRGACECISRQPKPKDMRGKIQSP